MSATATGPAGRLKILIGAFGDPGHAFPAIALGKELRARDHDVTLQTWRKWKPNVESEGMRFEAAPEYHVFPTRERPLKPYEAVVRAVRETRPLVRALAPDVVVSDILTLAPALTAELEGRPWGTLIPHLFPPSAPGLPPFGLGAMPPRSRVGTTFWRAISRASGAGLEHGRLELNETRRRVGLGELAHVHGGISRQLALVCTFPQLEYRRAWPPDVHVTGPLLWEPPSAAVAVPPGEQPLVVVAPSTSQDPRQRLLEVSLAGLSSLPVRILAVHPRGQPPLAGDAREGIRLVEWMPLSQTLPLADVVVCHGGHGILAHALSNGVPVVTVPAAGDMIENGTRIQRAGVGLSLPRRLLSPITLRLVVQRLLDDPSFEARARELSGWAAANGGAAKAADLTERLGQRATASAGSFLFGSACCPRGPSR